MTIIVKGVCNTYVKIQNLRKMPVYKLIYFDAKWRGEVIRLAFTAAGQEFEDRRIAGEEWPSIKPSK